MAKIGEAEQLALNASVPPHLFVFNALLFPLIAALNLATCAVLYAQPFGGRYFLIATLAFLLTNVILDTARVQVHSGGNVWLTDLLDIGHRWLLVVGLVYGLAQVSGLSVQLNRQVLLLWTISTPLGMWITQLAVRAALQRRSTEQYAARRAVIVGITDVGLRLEEKIRKSPVLGTRVLGYFEDRGAERLPAGRNYRILGKPAQLQEYVQNNQVQVVYVTLPMSRQQRIVDLLDNLRDSTASIYFVPDLFVFNLIQARVDVLGGIPLIAVRESPLYAGRSIAKRLADVVMAVGILLALSPVLLFAGIGIKLTSPGPILFRQQRYGLDGQPIRVCKFRSMRVTEDGAKAYTQVTRGDPRVTQFGALLRKTSIDELPQLLNVLEGSMSIVGPRPHVVAVNEQYRRLIPGYMIRHKVKPGITGWAQVNGYRGGDDLESMTKRIECDLEYLRCWSMGLDLRIILRTILVVWHDRRAF